MRCALAGLSPIAPKGHKHRTHLRRPLRPKEILFDSLEEALVRRFSISIPNLTTARMSTSSGTEDTM
jgi:hypothetical protein